MSLLKPGCYALSFSQVYNPPDSQILLPTGAFGHANFLGTLRVTQQDNGLSRVSADWYQTRAVEPLLGVEPTEDEQPPAGQDEDDGDDWEEPELVEVVPPDPYAGVPIFPFHAYDSHLRVVRAETGSNELTLWMERYRYVDQDFHRTYSARATYVGCFEFRLTRQTGVGSFPDPDEHWVGQVQDAAGQILGVISLGWVSPSIRTATLEVDFEDGAVIPLDNGQGLSWQDVFRRIGWEMTVTHSDRPVSRPSAFPTWSREALHEAMLINREGIDLDSQWYYHLLCVKELDVGGYGAVMYDRTDDDANQISREGFAVASDHVLPDRPHYGRAAGKRTGEFPTVLFRAAVHEMGHAVGLGHPHKTADVTANGAHFMQTTADIAELSTADDPFPDNILYSFSDSDTVRLQHSPDILIRPGGPFRGGAFEYVRDPPPPVPVCLARHATTNSRMNHQA